MLIYTVLAIYNMCHRLSYISNLENKFKTYFCRTTTSKGLKMSFLTLTYFLLIKKSVKESKERGRK